MTMGKGGEGAASGYVGGHTLDGQEEGEGVN